MSNSFILLGRSNILFSAEELNNIVETNYSNYASDGISIMPRQAHFDFFIRSLLQLNIMLSRQLPSSYDVQIDVDAFLQSFSRDSGALTSTPWPLGPGGSVHRQPDPLSLTELARSQFKNSFYPYAARGISTISNSYPAPLPPRRRRKSVVTRIAHVISFIHRKAYSEGSERRRRYCQKAKARPLR